MGLLIDSLRRKSHRICQDPFGVLSGRLQYGAQTVREHGMRLVNQVRFTRPIDDGWHWLVNRGATKIYELEFATAKFNDREQQIFADLEKNGIAICDFADLFHDVNLAQVQQAAESRLNDPINQDLIRQVENGARTTGRWKFYLIRLLGEHRVFSWDDIFLRLSLDESVLRIVARYLGLSPRVADIDLWCNVATLGPDYYSQRWHRDPDDKKLVKLFLYLRDVDELGGPFCYVPGSQNGGPFGYFYPQKLDESQYPPAECVEREFAKDNIQTGTGKAGTLIFCNTTGLHRGGHPRAGLRLLFTAVYTSNAGLFHNQKHYGLQGPKPSGLTRGASYGVGHIRE